jgi:hypothetical protein
MNDIEKAIEHFREAIQKDTDYPECAAYWGQRKRNYTLALAALREKQEREKGCNACWDDADNEPEYIGAGLDEYGRECRYLTLGEQTIMIHYCPICGRRLEDGQR